MKSSMKASLAALVTASVILSGCASPSRKTNAVVTNDAAADVLKDASDYDDELEALNQYHLDMRNWKRQNQGTVDVSLLAVGDILMHGPVIKSCYDASSGKYDFRENYKFVKDYIEKADYAVANLEGSVAGAENGGYTGYPNFNMPDEVLDALKWAGFDMVTAANNHTNDRGLKGIKRTHKVVKDKGLEIVGIRENNMDKQYEVKDIKGIKIGFANFAYETERIGDRKSLNGNPLSVEAEQLVDTFSYERMDESLRNIEDRVDNMRKDGAQVVVVSMHWGTEYMRMPNDYQKNIARKLSDMGVDVILGCHPHVVEPIEFIRSQKTGKETFVIYSMGNFVSNQRVETLNNRYTEQGIMVKINISKNLGTGETHISSGEYIPTWVNRQSMGGNLKYEVVPVPDALKGKGNFDISGEDSRNRVRLCENDTESLMNSMTDRAVMAEKR